MWLSVDPLADKYPGTSPYMYCLGNPVKYIDPDGKEIWIASPNGIRLQYRRDGKLYDGNGNLYKGNDVYTTSIQGQLNQLRKENDLMETAIGVLVDKSHINTIEMSNDNSVRNARVRPTSENNVSGWELMDAGISTGSIIFWDPTLNETLQGERVNPRVLFAHELWHSFEINMGELDRRTLINGIKKCEINAVMIENSIRKITGSPPRTKYGDNTIPDVYINGSGSQSEVNTEKAVNRNTRYFD